jgi:hypothetical protein
MSSKQEEKRRFKRVFDIMCRIKDVLDVIVIVAFISIGPVIVYYDDVILNWFYVVGISATAILGIFTCALHVYTGNNLITLCTASSDMIKLSEEIKTLINRITITTTVAKRYIVLQIIITFIPLWMWITSTNSNTPSGIYGIFYFHFTVMHLLMLTSILNNIYAITRPNNPYTTQSSRSRLITHSSNP